MPRMFTGHQITTQRRTDRCPRQRRRETDALRCKAVDVRGLDVRIPHVRQLVVRKLIGHDVNDVRLLRSQRHDRRDHQNRG